MDRKRNDSFIVSQENWSLHRKGYQDQKRHMEKVKEAIQERLPDLITEESIVLSNGKDVIKIPIRSLDEYKIRYNYENSKHVGQGDGNSSVGDVIAKDKEGNGAQGKGKEAGNRPGQDYYEAEVSFSELEDLLFSELELPDLQQKDSANLQSEKIDFNDIRKKGLLGNIDKKRTLLTAIRRNAMSGEAKIAPLDQDDLRFKTWNDIPFPESKAVVLAMMDTSASMGTFEKYIARSFFFWMTKFLRQNYKTVEIEFIAHQTDAKVVTEEEFFSKGESGGTRCSSAYAKALDLIHKKYKPNEYNIYPFHFSDGENMSTDTKLCLELVHEMMAVANMFGYGEVNEDSRYSTMMAAFKQIEDPKFKHYILRERQDVYHALKSFFQKRTGEAV